MIIYEEILRAFQEKKVKYILVGGIAFNLLGGLRSTSDLDILVDMTDNNLAKIVSILKDLGFHVKQSVDPMGIANKEIRSDWINNKHMKAFNFYKEEGFKEVDIIIESPVNYKEAKKDAILIKVDNLRLPVISVKNLIKMKKKAGRDIDLIDIKDLKLIDKIKKRKNGQVGK